MTRVTAFALTLVLAACGSPTDGPQTGSQTNWLLACEVSSECGELECICGACTASCAGDDACGGLEGASCSAPSEDRSLALCGGHMPAHGVCLPDGVPTARVTIDTGERNQTLVGFGASLAYAEGAIVARQDKAALYDLVFVEAGLDAIRMRNRYGSELAPEQEIVAAAAQRLGRAPRLFITSGTPPAELKANASRTCAGDLETCTLASPPGTGFDYAGFASYWRDSLEQYAAAGLSPDYLSIQNNPNWVPPVDAPHEGCRFLPEEGTTQVVVDGAPVDVAYPGYREALAAVRAAIADVSDAPELVVPEVSNFADVTAYATALGAADVGAVALHLYGMDALEVDATKLASVRELAAQLGRPVFQTEMQAEGFETAILMHHVLTSAGGSAYLQNDLVGLTPDAAKVALVLLGEGSLQPQAPYYALMHFAKHTDPGWIRAGARSAASELLASAWLAPDERALTIVLVNAGTEAVDAELALSDVLRAQLGRSELIRTTFEGDERGAVLGALSPSGVVRLPPYSIATVALTSE